MYVTPKQALSNQGWTGQVRLTSIPALGRNSKNTCQTTKRQEISKLTRQILSARRILKTTEIQCGGCRRLVSCNYFGFYWQVSVSVRYFVTFVVCWDQEQMERIEHEFQNFWRNATIRKVFRENAIHPFHYHAATILNASNSLPIDNNNLDW